MPANANSPFTWTKETFNAKAEAIQKVYPEKLLQNFSSKFGSTGYRFFENTPPLPTFTPSSDLIIQGVIDAYGKAVMAWYDRELANFKENRLIFPPSSWTEEKFAKNIASLQKSYNSSGFLKNFFDKETSATGYRFFKNVPVAPNYFLGSDKQIQDVLDSFQATLNQWYIQESKNVDASRIMYNVPNSLNTIGEIKTEEAFFNFVDGVRNRPDSLRLMNQTNDQVDVISKKRGARADEVSYEYKTPGPILPQFDFSDPEGNFRRLAVYQYLYLQWVKSQINKPDLVTVTIKFSENGWMLQCDGQSTSISRVFAVYRSILSKLEMLAKNESANPDTKEKNDDLQILNSQLPDIRHNLEIYVMKLPFYLKDSPKCVIYAVQLREAKDLLFSLEEVQQNFDATKVKSKSLTVNNFDPLVFDRSLVLIKEQFSQVKKIEKSTSTLKTDMKLPVICVKKGSKEKVTVDALSCPVGYTLQL